MLASVAFATNQPTVDGNYVVSNAGDYVDVYAPLGTTQVNITVTAENAFYLYAGPFNPTTEYQKDVQYFLTGGATVVRNDNAAINNLFGLRNNVGTSATFTIDNGTYNFGVKKDGVAYNPEKITFQTFEETGGNDENKKMIFGANSVVNAFGQRLSIESMGSTSTIMKGTVNVYNTAIPSFTKSVEVPTDATYGTFAAIYSGKTVIDGGTVNASQIVTTGTGISVINGGKFNLYADTAVILAKNMVLGDGNTTTQEKITANGNLTFRQTTNFVSKANSLIETAGFVNVGDTNGKSSIEIGGTLDIKGKSGSNSLILEKESSVVFDENSKLFVASAGRIYMNSDSVLTIKEGAEIEAEFIHTIKNVRIELKGTEVLRNSSGTSSAGLLLNAGSTPTIYVSETNTIRTVSINNTANTINLELGFTGAEDFIAFNDIYATNMSSNVDVVFNVKNFENNRIKIQLSTNSINSGLLSGNVLLNTFNEASESYESANVNLVATGVSGVYWLNVAVPEPAEWAMILGSLALGFAMYRRRK